MPKVKITDDFYPGLSIYKNLRQTPQSVITRYSDLLKVKNFATSDANLRFLLNTSKQLYHFVVTQGKSELNVYEEEIKRTGKQIRGGFFPPFELVFQLLSQMLEYMKTHPRDALETAADLVVLADYVEKKVGPSAGGLVRKIPKNSHKLGQRLLRLSKKTREADRKRKKQSKPRSRRKSTPNYIR